MRIARSGEQPCLTSSIASWRSTSVRAASATASSPGNPTRISSLVRQRSTRSSSVSTTSISCAAGISAGSARTFGQFGQLDLPLRGDFMQLLNGGCAEQAADLGEEVGNRVHAVVIAELELLLAVRRDDVDVDERFARELL